MVYCCQQRKNSRCPGYTYPEDYVDEVVDGLESGPTMPLGAAVVLAPAAEVLVEIECSGAVSHLDVSQPFRDDVQEGCVEADGSPDDGDNDPALRGLVQDKEPVPPVDLAAVVEAGGALPARFPALSFLSSILDPICVAA